MSVMNRKITPHLWFDTQAKEAAEFYTSVFPDSHITQTTTIHNVPSPTGDSDIVHFMINDQPFMAISAGPIFKINPSISFFVNFDPSIDPSAKEHLNELWEKLSDGGLALMPLGKYPFSKWYGWIQDKYGISWQLMLTNPTGEKRPYIIPSLMFTQEGTGRAEEAMDFYCTVFRDGKVGSIAKYPEGAAPDEKSKLMFGDFNILDTWIAAMDSGKMHDFSFNEAVSLVIPCETQEEIDYYWEKLSAVKESEQCGWLKDKFGVSWQVWPVQIGEMMKTGKQEQIDRMTQVFLPMKKLEIDPLKKAFEGEVKA